MAAIQEANTAGAADGISSAAAEGAAISEAVGTAKGDPRIAMAGMGQAGAMIAGFSEGAEAVGNSSGSPMNRGVAGGGVAGIITARRESPDVAEIKDDVTNPDPVDALWDNVRAQRALMQAILQNRPQTPVGPGHNRGPEFAPTIAQDLVETNRLIELLSEAGPHSRVRAGEILEVARSAANTAERGKTAINAFALAVVAGAGQFVGNKGLELLTSTPWFKAFYAQLADLAAAAIALVHAIL
ncbi:hypothetical protein [Bradyrhizobium sp. Arg816]|uniref:hypothetical protein n=1 Tax=Bradyrhizobium sp. Arg816 TaxID=2998491 RepID=UPI00249DACE3|nr:hypothetical protein [Bradyrhizobium sp. Arg816]MDI3566654.1 hypothetical protein [Bradyrhizobium sp. Arg816]